MPAALCEAMLTALRDLQWPVTSARPGVTADGYLVLSTKRSAESLGARHPHHPLRHLCDQLICWHQSSIGASSSFPHTAIAVTRNFVGSAHIDQFDTGTQLAISLGDFEGGAGCSRDSWPLLSSLPPSHLDAVEPGPLESCPPRISTRGGGRRGRVHLLTGNLLTGIRTYSPSLTHLGELCVEEEGEDANEFVAVVDTHNRLAEVDGRRVHWVWRPLGDSISETRALRAVPHPVTHPAFPTQPQPSSHPPVCCQVRPFRGSDRFSLIFYRTES